MRSSSTEPGGGARFLPVGAGAWARLGLVAALGAGAVAAPAVDRTGAIYTDVERVAFDIQGPPAPTPTADPTTAAAEPTPLAVAAPTALPADALAPATDPTTTDPTTTDPTTAAAQPGPSPSPDTSPSPSPTLEQPTVPLPTPWQQGPSKPHKKTQ